MNKKIVFPTTTDILSWAGTKAFAGRLFDTIYIVSKNRLFHYFITDESNQYNLVMTSEKNLCEEI